VPLVMDRVSPQSVVDFGCGIGVWLETFARHGVDDYLGLDGPLVPRDALRFPKERLVAAQLDRALELPPLRPRGHPRGCRASTRAPRRAARSNRRRARAVRRLLGGDSVPGRDRSHQRAVAGLLGRALRTAMRSSTQFGRSSGRIPPSFRSTGRTSSSSRHQAISSHPLLAQDRERTVEAQLSVVHPELMESIAAHPYEQVRRPSARDLMLS
jgi:hypothetical protein